MNNTTSNPRVAVFGNEIDRCPDCRHIWTDDAECHYHDCRYFSLDQEMELEEDELKYKLPWAGLPPVSPAT